MPIALAFSLSLGELLELSYFSLSPKHRYGYVCYILTWCSL